MSSIQALFTQAQICLCSLYSAQTNHFSRDSVHVGVCLSRLAKHMWETSHSSYCCVTYCEWRASHTALLALASVHAGENLHVPMRKIHRKMKTNGIEKPHEYITCAVTVSSQYDISVLFCILY